MVKNRGTTPSGRGSGSRRTTTTDEGKGHEGSDRKTHSTPRSPSRTTNTRTSKGKK